MKNTKITAVILAVILFATSNVFALDMIGTTIQSDVVSNKAVEFLSKIAYNGYMYDEYSYNIDPLTTASFSEEKMSKLTNSISTVYAVDSSKDSKESIDNIRLFSDWINGKNEYLIYTREKFNINRSEFNQTCAVIDIRFNGNFAEVDIKQFISFKYDFTDDYSALIENHTVKLYKDGLSWYVYDDVSDSIFDSIYPRSFDFVAAKVSVDEVYDEVQASKADNMQSSSESLVTYQEEIQEVSILSASDDLSVRVYDQAAAKYYALTYALEPNDRFDYYSGSSGTDCANFASQCIYAGFGGNDDSVTLADTNRPIPMDNTGNSSSQMWYLYSSTWNGTSNLKSYIENSSSCSSSTQDFIEFSDVSGVYRFDQFTSVHPSLLAGAVLVLPSIGYSSAGGYEYLWDYGHAGIITMSGYNVEQICFSAHSSNTMNISLADYFGTCTTSEFLLGVPTYFKMKVPTSHTHSFTSIGGSGEFDATCNGAGCKYNKIVIETSPIPTYKKYTEGGTNRVTIRGICADGVIPYRMSAKVERYSENQVNGSYTLLSTTWLGDVTGTGTYQKTYTYPGEGLYRVTIFARDYVGNPVNYYRTYAFRVDNDIRAEDYIIEY